VFGIDRETAEQLKKLLEKGTDYDGVGRLVIRSNLRWQEMEAYLSVFKPKYEAQLALSQAGSAESRSAQALMSLTVRPMKTWALKALFECEPDLSFDDQLIARYGLENVAFYVGQTGHIDDALKWHAFDIGKVRKIPASHPLRKGFEQLAEVKLADRGRDIPTPDIAETLTIKQISELVADKNPPPFKRKPEAIEFASSLPDLSERLARGVPLQELFRLKPLPNEFSAPEIPRVRSCWEFARAVGLILMETYSRDRGDTEDRNLSPEERREVYGEVVSAWKITTRNDACPFCREAAARPLPKDSRPKVPLHVGCGCRVEAIA
jgi:hypothetical protein